MTMTMSVAHTPGPWDYNPGGVFSGFGTICVLAVGGSTGNNPDAAAVGAAAISNARLIAAAPDLLAACKLEETYRALKGDDGKGEADLRESLGIGPREHIGSAIAAVRRAAIRKAEGVDVRRAEVTWLADGTLAKLLMSDCGEARELCDGTWLPVVWRNGEWEDAKNEPSFDSQLAAVVRSQELGRLHRPA